MNTFIPGLHQIPENPPSDQSSNESAATKARASHSVFQNFPQTFQPQRNAPGDPLMSTSANSQFFGNPSQNEAQNPKVYQPPHRRSGPGQIERPVSNEQKVQDVYSTMREQFEHSMASMQYASPLALYPSGSIPPGYNASTLGAHPVPYQYTPQYPRGVPPQNSSAAYAQHQEFDPATMYHGQRNTGTPAQPQYLPQSDYVGGYPSITPQDTVDIANLDHRNRANNNGSPQDRQRAQSYSYGTASMQPTLERSDQRAMNQPSHGHKQSKSTSSGSGLIQPFNTPSNRIVPGMPDRSHSRMHSSSNSDGSHKPTPMSTHHRMGSGNQRGKYGSISQGDGHVNFSSTSAPIGMPAQAHGRNDSVTGASGIDGMNAHQLAKLIMSGATEDPYDNSMKRYDTPERMAPPTLGPARFNDSKMFSKPMPTPAGRSMPRSSTQGGSVGLGPVSDLPPPDWLSLAWQGLCVPTMEETWDSLPLGERYREVGPSSCSVLRIKDIPYTATRAEIVAFMGGKAQIARQPDGSPWHAVHIIMERETGKTMDCFIELTSEAEATYQCDQFRRRAEAGRPPRVGERVVQVILSSQDELLSELFPRAKHVHWNNGSPIIDTEPKFYYEGIQAAGFQGFLHPEEFFTMARHAETNDRAIFASKSPSRVYETLISILYKYPWFATDYVSARERDTLFSNSLHLLKCLVYELSKEKHDQKSSPLDVTTSLLQELASAMLVCVGFTDRQKFFVVAGLHQSGYSGIAVGEGANLRLGGQHPYCAIWPFNSLCVKPGVTMDVLSYYALMLRTATVNNDPAQPMLHISDDDFPMGIIEIHYGQDYQQCTLASMANVEYDALKRILGKYLHDHHQQVNDPTEHGNILPVGQAGSAGQMAQVNNNQLQLYAPSGTHDSVPPSPFVSEDGFSHAPSTSTI